MVPPAAGLRDGSKYTAHPAAGGTPLLIRPAPCPEPLATFLRQVLVWQDYVEVERRVGIRIQLECAQIVPVKVKYFQTVANETKNRVKNCNRIKWL